VRNAVSGRLKCPITGELFPRTEAHVDHNDPWPFRRIVDEFIAEEKIDLLRVEYDGFEHGSTFVTLRDRALADRFVAFHGRVARLQVISKQANLEKSRAT
jgi:hypothetical protein